MKKKLLNIITAMIFIVSMIPAVIIPIATSNQVAWAAPTVVTYSTVESGNFTVPARVSTVTVLVIAGGGGGGAPQVPTDATLQGRNGGCGGGEGVGIAADGASAGTGSQGYNGGLNFWDGTITHSASGGGAVSSTILLAGSLLGMIPLVLVAVFGLIMSGGILYSLWGKMG